MQIYKSRLGQVRQDKHSRVWDTIFQNQAWLVKAMEAKVNPVLIGPNLQAYYSYRRRAVPAYVCLFTNDVTGDFVESSGNERLFFDCLKPYTFDGSTQEVKLDCGITLNVSDILGYDAVSAIPERILSCRFTSGLQSSYLFWEDDTHALRKLGSDNIIDWRGLAATRLSDVKNSCGVDLICPDGQQIYLHLEDLEWRNRNPQDASIFYKQFDTQL